MHTCHITFGTYATRLHNDPRPTVDRRHNIVGTLSPPPDPARQQKPSVPPLYLTRAQCEHIEKTIPQLCPRGGWTFITCAAPYETHRSEPNCEPGRVGPSHNGPAVCLSLQRDAALWGANHVHALLAAPQHIHGKQIRQWLKRWLSESLTATFGPPPKRWWAESGSTKPVQGKRYLNNVISYIQRQRTSS